MNELRGENPVPSIIRVPFTVNQIIIHFLIFFSGKYE